MQIKVPALRVSVFAVLALLLAGLLSGCFPLPPDEMISPLPVPEEASPLPIAEMTEAEARTIAEQGVCAEVGAPAEIAFFNPATGTWWVDLAADKPGCAPACVVDAATGNAEVNWRCTGLLPETPAPATATPTPLPPEPGNLALLATVKASSELRADRLGNYGPASAIDGSLSTPWCEGASGAGIGEWIELTFDGPVEVIEIGVDVGYDREADDTVRPESLFSDNRRLKAASFIFSGEQQAMIVFEDVRGVQRVSLAGAPGGPVVTTTVRLIIDDTYRGTRFEDTCIAEIEVWGWTR